MNQQELEKYLWGDTDYAYIRYKLLFIVI